MLTMQVFCLYLFYIFICYLISQCIKYIFMAESEDKKYNDKLLYSTPKISVAQKNNKYKIGDIIQLKFQVNEKLSYRHPARRSISTYGFEEIEPTENTDYIVTCLENYANIPNHKNDVNFNKSMNNFDTFMYVYPKKEFEEMNGMFEHTKEVFWFINIDRMTICQFEDAYPIFKINNIIKK